MHDDDPKQSIRTHNVSYCYRYNFSRLFFNFLVIVLCVARDDCVADLLCLQPPPTFFEFPHLIDRLETPPTFFE